MTMDLDALIDREISESPHRRRSPVLRNLYLQNTADSRMRSARNAFDLLVPFYAALVLLDFLLLHDVIIYSIVFRCIIGPIVWCMIRLRSFKNIDNFEYSIAGAVFLAIVMWVICMMTSNNNAGVNAYYSSGVMFVIVANVIFRWPFRVSLILSLAMTAILIGLGGRLSGGGEIFFISGVALSSVVCVFTLIANWSLGNERYAIFLQTLKTERQQATIERHSADLLRLSNTDALTGLANRRSVDESLRTLWQDWTERQRPYAAILIDVDYFKRFNDSYGHHAGDNCLVAVARTFERALEGRSALVGRYGGEEFIALVAVTHDEAVETAELLRQVVEGMALPHDWRPDGVTRVTVSVGVSMSVPGVGAGAEEIVLRADKALYRAKGEGRNRVELDDGRYDPLSTRAA